MLSIRSPYSPICPAPRVDLSVRRTTILNHIELFVCASFARVVTGWVLDRTGAFDVALSVCSGLTFLGVLPYLFVVKDPIRDAD